jgi:hypothetical protein
MNPAISEWDFSSLFAWPALAWKQALAAYGSEFNPHNGGIGLDSPGLMPPR